MRVREEHKEAVMQQPEDVVVGIDVAKAGLDVAIRPSGEAKSGMWRMIQRESPKRWRGCGLTART
jgi:hypothetical protein